MKRTTFVLGVLSVMLFFTSCKKEDLPVPESSNIIFTDNPPDALFTSGTPYGTSYQGWLDSSINQSKNQGYRCILDPWNQPYDCGYWFIVPARKYWGLLGDKIYVSQSREWYATSPNVYLLALDVIQRKKTGIAQLCFNCPNGVGTNNTITYVQ